MDSDLKNTIEKVEGEIPITIFHLRGWFGKQEEDLFVEWAGQAYEEGAKYLLLEMSELSTITSAGIRAIVKVYKAYNSNDDAKENPRLKMASASPPVYNVLKTTGILPTIPMFESVQSAIDSIKE
jgi:anti-anti-sigma factor